ncbi:MAG: preprotein translocase subunit SecA [Clostridia bacterium]|nr:preprotein translocase subunit SecA [Clostridia bacterium]
MDVLKLIFGDGNATELKRLHKIVDAIDSFEEAHKKLTEEQIKAQTQIFRDRLANGETLNDILPEAFSLVREATDRIYGKRHFRVQMIGGIVLHQGRIAEMKTGEGKTLTAALASYLNALEGKGVHIVTVNDYLARFQGDEIGRIHRYLGLTVGIILHGLTNDERRDAYACDITYATNNELGFDYLRDNMVIHFKEMVQRGHNFAIVDEVDSILIDEARTPLIISGQGEKSTEMYTRADQFVLRLREGEGADYVKDEKQKTCNLTEQGTRKAEQHFGLENLADMENNEIVHHINAALRAHSLMKRDVDYVVQNDQVVIVDEFTGRLMVGRRYSDGLHQAIEAKERVKVERESKTLATITFQNYFRMYKKLSGMTGTAKTEEPEFKSIYKLDVVQVPTNMPMVRRDMNDLVYQNVKIKFGAVIDQIAERHAAGQPVLVGTVSVETSELVSRLLTMRGIKHEVLNAKYHDKEAEIVAQAGHYGAVTIATNMAGRGTDILLGGNPEYLARRALRQQGYEEEVIEEAMGHNEHVTQEVLEIRKLYREQYSAFKKQTDDQHDRVVAVGGLHIIGTERHESRRIDNQLRGRSGRQGDPGSSQFIISLQDDLLRLFGSDRISGMISRLGLSDDQPIEANLLTKQIENAQKRIEGRNFDIRKNVLQYDDVMNQQREVIYSQRRKVLEGEDMRGQIMGMLRQIIDEAVASYTGRGEEFEEWDYSGLTEYLERLCVAPGTLAACRPRAEKWIRDELQEYLHEQATDFYTKREALITGINIDMRELERSWLLGAVDNHWMNHIDGMDHLRDGIGLRAYGNKNPVVEFKFESYEMFDEMVRLIREETLRRLYFTPVQQPVERKRVAVETQAKAKAAANAGAGAGGEPNRPKKADAKVGRNEPCPCGSGKKHKNCCGKAV